MVHACSKGGDVREELLTGERAQTLLGSGHLALDRS